MKEKFKPNIDERPVMIVLGVAAFYLIIEFFIVYLFLLHRINFVVMFVSSVLFMLIYLPRFLIIYKLKTRDRVKVIDEFLMINDIGVALCDILDFKVDVEKPQVVFFINNKMVVFQQAKFHLKLKNGITTFTVVGGEKIRLLEEFLRCAS